MPVGRDGELNVALSISTIKAPAVAARDAEQKRFGGNRIRHDRTNVLHVDVRERRNRTSLLRQHDA